MATMIQKQNWLLSTIRRKRRITFPELSQLWENASRLNDDRSPLSYRTFNRHVGAIKDLYGVTISCDRHTNEFYILNEENVDDGTMQTWLLDTIATENLVQESKALNDRILFESVPKGREHLFTIISAMKDSHTLKVSYRTFWNPEEYTMEIEPYFLKVYKQRWYLIGISDRHPGEIRVYGLDRMNSVEETENKFKYPKGFDPKEFCAKSFGIFLSDRKPEFVTLKVTDNQQSFVRSLPLHWSQKGVETHQEYSIFRYFLAPEYDFEQELLSRAGTVEVLEPKWLREEMKGLIEKMFNKYK